MATKNLAIREDVYRKLLDVKEEKESFSDVIDRLIERKGSVMSFAGVLAKDDAVELIESDIKEIRRRTIMRR